MDELSAPLGQNERKKPRRWPNGLLPKVFVTALAAFVVVVVAWATVVDDPFGGEPMVVVKSDPAAAPAQREQPSRYDSTASATAAIPATPPNAKTINIIDGASGKSQQVVIGAPASDAKQQAPVDDKLMETTRHGPVPRIGTDGTRVSAVYSQKPKTAAKPDAPRIAIVVGGLGISAAGTTEALMKLPPAATFAFAPYGSEIEQAVSRARLAGHEVLLQAPMEPQDYPDNDPGPQTLLTSLSPDQNIDRLQWQMSRFTGYVGIANYMGARFTATEAALSPVLKEAGKRGLIFVDDGSSPRSIASQIAGAQNIPFVKADVVIDTVPTGAEIEKALARLEATARERGFAVGFTSALPVAITRVSDWAKKAEARGIQLVPITAVAVKAKSS